MKVGIETQIGEALRELDMRKQVYPRQVARHQMRQAEADLKISYQQAIVTTLVYVRDNMEGIKAYAAAKRSGGDA